MIKSFRPYLIILLAGFVLFVPFLGEVNLFDWDEINFAESAREMLVTGNYSQVQVNYQPFWEKPPLFIWMQAISMKVFGVNEFAARFPNAVCGIITLLFIFYLGKRYFSERMGWLWVMSYIGAFTPHLYFKSGIIDPWFNLFIFSGIVSIAHAAEAEGKRRRLFYTLAGGLIGLALLTKGPVAILITLLCLICMFIWKWFRTFFNIWDVLLFALACAVVSFAWYGAETIKHGPWFITEFIRYQFELFSQPVAGHGQPWYYHPVVLLIGCFPASLIAFRAFGESLTRTDFQRVFKAWMSILFWVVLILFSMVETKIVHYSSLCYLPLTFISALVIENVLISRIQFRRLNLLSILLLGVALAALITLIPAAAVYEPAKLWLLERLNDPFSVANFQRPANWLGVEGIAGILFLAGLIYSLTMLAKRKYYHGFIGLCLSTALTLQLILMLLVPKIEQHSQGAAIQFFKLIADQDAYVETLGYKSYAQYFYARVKPRDPEPESLTRFRKEYIPQLKDVPAREIEGRVFRQWLLDGEIDKQAYFSCRNIEADIYRGHPGLEELYHDGGFVFFRRQASGDRRQAVR